MSKQIILVKSVSLDEYERIRQAIENGLEKDKGRFCVHALDSEATIEIIELPGTDEVPMVIHNTHIGMQQADLEAMVSRLLAHLANR